MKPILFTVSALLLLCCQPARAQTPPGADIFLADLTIKDDTPAIGTLHNLTGRPGYDNQPYFLPDGSALFYTAEVDGQTDTLLYTFSTESTTNLTDSDESEYSPTPIASGDLFSVIFAPEGIQELWAYERSTGERYPLLEPDFLIGYHAWIDSKQVLITVLTDNAMQLYVADVTTKDATLVAPSTGASLFNIPGSDNMSFNARVDGKNWVMMLNPKTRDIQPLVQLPDDSSYYTWTPDGKVLAASQGSLWFWDSQKPGSALTRFADISDTCPDGASRLAVNPAQTLIAVVCHGEGM
ncbi:TolB family protein [Alteromonas sp. CYL-A6]|uniref:TolB family protein n=1 Tax=Alteromonas nitratireducens TaxID=3390813 RepID=UPI0034ADB6CF